MDHVVLRDSQSKLLTDSAKTFINTQVSFDLALTLNEKFRTKKIQKQYDTIGLVITERAVGMCGSNHTSGCLTILNALDKALRDFSQAKVRILCICNDQRDGDRDISQHVHHTLTARWGSRIQVMYYEEEKIEDMLNAIEECSLLISARLHAGIMGILSAVPVYQISYAEKIRNIFVHSELSTEYLFDHANITQQSISEFIARAIKGKLTEFANNQQVLLKEKGQRVISCLDNVVR